MDQRNYTQGPSPELIPRPAVLSFLPDHHLPYVVPAIVFWVISFTFHYIDTRGLLSKYKLHTPAEDLTKNRASRNDVIRFALIQQAAQCTLGYLTAGPDPFIPHEYAIAAWVQRICYTEALASRWLQYLLPGLTWFVDESRQNRLGSGVTFVPESHNGQMVNFSQIGHAQNDFSKPNISAWKLVAATNIYWIIAPLFQYISAMVLADTMQYFTHRAYHVNKWLYKHVHSMHHDVYVPFAYGAFYNHPLETIPIDGILFPLCLSIAGLDNRQAAIFGAIWTFKTVVDHCGYDFPYNPCNIVCPHSVLFHDLHHQSWGMKYNFSVYGSIWDWVMGTHWSPFDEKAREKYARGKATAEAKVAKPGLGVEAVDSAVGNSTAVEV